MSMVSGPHDDRDRAMYAFYAGGATLQEVGDRFGVSRERVRQVFRQRGWTTRSIKDVAALQRAAEHALAPKIIELYEQVDDVREIARRLDVSQTTVRDVIKAARRARPASESRRKHGNPQKVYSDEDLLMCLRTASQALGGVLTTSAYGEFIKGRFLDDGRPWPTHQAVQLRFGSWRAALVAAGLRANPSSPIAGQRIFEVAHCVDAVRHVAREVGHAPSASEYERAARASSGGLPSLATVRHRCGGWLDALAAAGL